MTITIVNIETTTNACVLVGPRDKREALRVGMLARLLVLESNESTPRRTPRRELPWVKIIAIDQPPPLTYIATLVSETWLDVDDNHVFEFGPEHVCEWSVEPQARKASKGMR